MPGRHDLHRHLGDAFTVQLPLWVRCAPKLPGQLHGENAGVQGCTFPDGGIWHHPGWARLREISPLSCGAQAGFSEWSGSENVGPILLFVAVRRAGEPVRFPLEISDETRARLL